MKTSLSLRFAAAVVIAGLTAISPGPSTRSCLAAHAAPAPYTGPDLSAAQKAQVKSLAAQAQKKLKVITSNPKLTQQQVQQQEIQLQAWFNAQTMATLTTSQRSDLLAHRKEFQDKMMVAQSPKTKLMSSLTPKQKLDIQALYSGQQTQTQMLVQNTKLTQQQKQMQYHAILANNASKIQTILTPEQRLMSSKIDALLNELRQMSPRQQATPSQ